MKTPLGFRYTQPIFPWDVIFVIFASIYSLVLCITLKKYKRNIVIKNVGAHGFPLHLFWGTSPIFLQSWIKFRENIIALHSTHLGMSYSATPSAIWKALPCCTLQDCILLIGTLQLRISVFLIKKTFCLFVYKAIIGCVQKCSFMLFTWVTRKK